VSRPLLRLACPAGHMLAHIVAVRGVGLGVTGNRTIRVGSSTWTSAFTDSDGTTYEDLPGPRRSSTAFYRRTRETTPLASLESFRCQCRCGPDPIPGQWLQDRLADGTRDVTWDWQRYALENITPS
jgi:hypothetical protein